MAMNPWLNRPQDDEENGQYPDPNNDPVVPDPAVPNPGQFLDPNAPPADTVDGPGGVPPLLAAPPPNGNDFMNPHAPPNDTVNGPGTPPGGQSWWMTMLRNLNSPTGGGNNASNAIAGAAGAINQSAQAAAQRDATAQLQNQRVALEQSQQNPQASLMFQTKNAYQADQIANGDFSSKPITIAGRYGDAVGPVGGKDFNPSPSVRGNARAALALILAGNRTPTMTDPSNYGKEPMVENAPDYNPPWLATTRAPATRPPSR